MEAYGGLCVRVCCVNVIRRKLIFLHLLLRGGIGGSWFFLSHQKQKPQCHILHLHLSPLHTAQREVCFLRGEGNYWEMQLKLKGILVMESPLASPLM
ncbi:hypothetical protein SLE2022_038160 [Rubroshorea leprosula]